MLREIARLLRRGNKGQDMIEFAMVAPLLILLVMGIVDFGRGFNTWLMVTHGAREGARYAAVGHSDAEIVARVQTTTAGLPVQVTIAPAAGARTQGQPVSVTVSTTMQLLTQIIAGIFGVDSFPVSSAAEMRYEGPGI